MLKTRPDATRQAMTISADDLEAVLRSLTCTVISIENEEVGVLGDVEYIPAENKYEPQYQDEYLHALKTEVLSCLCYSCYIVLLQQRRGVVACVLSRSCIRFIRHSVHQHYALFVCHVAALFTSSLTAAKLCKPLVFIVTGASARTLVLDSKGKGQPKHAEDYHEHRCG